MVDSAPNQAEPLAWRIPPYQTAVLLLIVCGCAAVNIYARPAPAGRALSLALGLVALGFAVAALRMYLVVRDDGVAVRFVGAEVWLPWSEIEDVRIVSGVRGSNTLRFTRADGGLVDVPPSLLQPSRPTSKPAAAHLMKDVLRQVLDRRP